MTGTDIMELSKLVQTLYGGVQVATSKTPEMPQYKIPPSAKAELNLYKELAGTSELPGESLIMDKLFSEGASARKEMREAGARDYSDILGKEYDVLKDLAIKKAELQEQRKYALAGAYGRFAEYEQKPFEYDFYKWQTEMNRQLDKRKSGTENIFKGLSGIGESMAMQEYMNMMYPRKGGLDIEPMTQMKSSGVIPTTGINQTPMFPSSYPTAPSTPSTDLNDVYDVFMNNQYPFLPNY